MSRKHFEVFARAIADIVNKAERKRTAHLIADVCRSFNGQFDRDRFYRACNVN